MNEKVYERICSGCLIVVGLCCLWGLFAFLHALYVGKGWRTHQNQQQESRPQKRQQ
ncbi:MAG: hypothetical protein ACFCD0_25165 [Gemmataceae bacterium]